MQPACRVVARQGRRKICSLQSNRLARARLPETSLSVRFQSSVPPADANAVAPTASTVPAAPAQQGEALTAGAKDGGSSNLQGPNAPPKTDKPPTLAMRFFDHVADHPWHLFGPLIAFLVGWAIRSNLSGTSQDESIKRIDSAAPLHAREVTALGRDNGLTVRQWRLVVDRVFSELERRHRAALMAAGDIASGGAGAAGRSANGAGAASTVEAGAASGASAPVKPDLSHLFLRPSEVETAIWAVIRDEQARQARDKQAQQAGGQAGQTASGAAGANISSSDSGATETRLRLEHLHTLRRVVAWRSAVLDQGTEPLLGQGLPDNLYEPRGIPWKVGSQVDAAGGGAGNGSVSGTGAGEGSQSDGPTAEPAGRSAALEGQGSGTEGRPSWLASLRGPAPAGRSGSPADRAPGSNNVALGVGGRLGDRRAGSGRDGDRQGSTSNRDAHGILMPSLPSMYDATGTHQAGDAPVHPVTLLCLYSCLVGGRPEPALVGPAASAAAPAAAPAEGAAAAGTPAADAAVVTTGPPAEDESGFACPTQRLAMTVELVRRYAGLVGLSGLGAGLTGGHADAAISAAGASLGGNSPLAPLPPGPFSLAELLVATDVLSDCHQLPTRARARVIEGWLWRRLDLTKPSTWLAPLTRGWALASPTVILAEGVKDARLELDKLAHALAGNLPQAAIAGSAGSGLGAGAAAAPLSADQLMRLPLPPRAYALPGQPSAVASAEQQPGGDGAGSAVSWSSQARKARQGDTLLELLDGRSSSSSATALSSGSTSPAVVLTMEPTLDLRPHLGKLLDTQQARKVLLLSRNTCAWGECYMQP